MEFAIAIGKGERWKLDQRGESMTRMGSEDRDRIGRRVGAIEHCDFNGVISIGPLDRREEMDGCDLVRRSQSQRLEGWHGETCDCDRGRDCNWRSTVGSG